MSSIKTGFGRQLGRLGANAVGNKIAEWTGLDQSEHRTFHRGENKAKEQAEARANKSMLNSIDSAVIDNVDEVRDIVFSENPKELFQQLETLEVQMASETWRMAIGGGSEEDQSQNEENKIRNKYPDALYAKFRKGIEHLEKIDPFYEGIFHFKIKKYLWGWKKFILKYMPFSIFGIFIGALAIPGICTEKYAKFTETHQYVIFWGVIGLCVFLRLYIPFRRQIHALLHKHKAS